MFLEAQVHFKWDNRMELGKKHGKESYFHARMGKWG